MSHTHRVDRSYSQDVPPYDAAFEPMVTAVRQTDPPLPAAEMLRLARWLYEQRAYRSAELLLESLTDDDARTVESLKLRRSVASKVGDLTTAVHISNELASQRKVTVSDVRLVSGRLMELYGALPTISGPSEKIHPRDQKTIVHLVKESVPYRHNGFCSRSHYNFIAERDAGYKVVVLTEPGFPEPGSTPLAVKTEQIIDGISYYHFSLGSAAAASMPVDQLMEIWAELAYQKIKIIKPSVVHASSGRRGYETALVAAAVARKGSIPFVYEVRSFFESNWTGEVAREETGEIFKRRLAAEKYCMDLADRVLTIGQAMRWELISRGVEPSKIDVIPNGVQADSFSNPDPARDLRQEIGLPHDLTFGYVSNMDHYRESQETLIECSKYLRDAGTPMNCLLVGDGPRRALLESYATELGVSDLVFFTGRVDHESTPAFYALIDFFVIPRINERSARFVTPLKPFEAMAAGCLVMVSDLPALTEIVDPPNRGAVFPVGDAAELARLIMHHAAHPELSRAMTEAGNSWVRTQRSWSSNGARYAESYSRAIASRKV